ncbi:MAG: branched-chain amino acid ABC transporter permease [Hyphomicrobiales bacterium]|nr:branched-chain amino acid ABC transporter permease [Hyphomicrobiales bacterium]MBV8824634.1 branched-chain amino acid ABC transporter permease [Hyphomicrobiales bacterium]
MPEVLQLLVAGLATGAVYALAAIGFTLLWQTSQTINFAQGEFVMLPAFIVLLAMNIGLPFPAAILIGVAASLLVLGFLFKQTVVDRISRHGALPLAIATIALGLVIKEGVKDVAGPAALPFPPLGGTSSLAIGAALLPVHSLIAIVVAVAAIAGLQAFLDRTPLGRSIQATAQNPAVARVLGIPVDRMTRYAFLINAALTALASILVTPVYLASFSNGEWLGLCTFVAALAGGLNLRGAIVGGLALGFIDNLAAAFLSATWRGALPLVILIAVALFRPQGLLGRSEEPAA